MLQSLHAQCRKHILYTGTRGASDSLSPCRYDAALHCLGWPVILFTQQSLITNLLWALQIALRLAGAQQSQPNHNSKPMIANNTFMPCTAC